MRKLIFGLLTLGLLLALTGCGKKGPLYWVDPNAAPPQDSKSATPVPAK